MNCSLPGSSVDGILQSRILEWVAISFSRGTSLPKNWTQVSCIADALLTQSANAGYSKHIWNYEEIYIYFVTTLTIDHQASLSMGFPQQEYLNGFPFSPPGDLPNPGIKPASPALQANTLPLNHQGRLSIYIIFIKKILYICTFIPYIKFELEGCRFCYFYSL